MKTSFVVGLRGTIDPHSVPTRTLSKDERDMAIAAKRCWVVAFDNLSSLSDKMSDALCQLATGGGFGTRGLYSDDSEKLFFAKRPIIVNGIEDAVRNADILSRAVTLELPKIKEESYRTEDIINQELADCRPRVLGALLTIASDGLRRLGDASGDAHGRMADFIRWVEVCEPALGWAPGTFLKAYKQNRDEQVEIALSGDPLADAVLKFMATRRVWEGSATSLKTELRECWDDPDKASWGMQNRNIGGRLRRIASSLRKVGIVVSSHKTAATRLITLERIPTPAPKDDDNDDKDDDVHPFENPDTISSTMATNDKNDNDFLLKPTVRV